MGDPRHERGVKSQIRDTATGNAHSVTLQRTQQPRPQELGHPPSTTGETVR